MPEDRRDAADRLGSAEAGGADRLGSAEASGPAPTEEAPRPSSHGESARAGVPLLQVAWPFALVAVVTVILGRAVGPSIAGTGVGMDRLILVVETAGKILSQLFAVAAIV